MTSNFNYLYTSFIIAAITLISACDLVELDSPAPQDAIPSPVGFPDNAEAFITAISSNERQEWQALTFNLEGLDGFQNCRLDDTFVFFGNGTYRYDGGEVLCGGADDERIKTGTWKADFDNLQIIFDETTDLESIARLIGIQDNHMELASTVDIFGQTLAIQGIYEIKE